ncbi:MAG: sugar phosphate isomerase/epimerase [Lentisphaerae bacterium]|jgi:sugar phosphate isomerase/epimerase|nr:sugar phosphate isomerase/epimerase [Lentisphaerota bacterium]
MTAPLAFYFNWNTIPDELHPRVIREFLDHGIEDLVFINPVMESVLANPSRKDFYLGLAERMGVRFIGMHSPYGKTFDLSLIEPDRKPLMIQDHVKALETCAEFGSKTYTMHLGTYPYAAQNVKLEQLREHIVEALEKLLPEAERLGVVIAIENGFSANDSAEELLYYINHFNHPYLGVCYDTGHAHIVTPYPWKKREKYHPHVINNWIEPAFQECPNSIDLLQPHIVTCHIHDNSGYADQHGMPFDGTLPWEDLMPKLFNCPRMLEYQTEVSYTEGKIWCGEALSNRGGYSINHHVQVFRKLGFSW